MFLIRSVIPLLSKAEHLGFSNQSVPIQSMEVFLTLSV
jgi:hypothetical protein